MSTLFATSTPRSLRFATTSSGGEAYLIEDWRMPRSSVDLAFDVMVQGSGYAQIGGLTLGPSYYELLFQVTGGTISFNEWNSANGSTTHSLGATAAGWHRVTLHADLAVAGGKSPLRVGLDGVTRFQGMTAVSLPALGSVQAIVGLLYVDSAPKVVFADNVTIDSKP